MPVFMEFRDVKRRLGNQGTREGTDTERTTKDPYIAGMVDVMIAPSQPNWKKRDLYGTRLQTRKDFTYLRTRSV